MVSQVRKFVWEEEAQDVVEYALLLVLVAIAIAVASPNITNAIVGVFSRIASLLGGQ